jgi:hypothetical protein
VDIYELSTRGNKWSQKELQATQTAHTDLVNQCNLVLATMREVSLDSIANVAVRAQETRQRSKLGLDESPSATQIGQAPSASLARL